MAQKLFEPNRIREIRVSKGLTLEQVAERADTTNQQISKLETRKARLSVDWMVRIARALGVEPQDLLPPKQESAAKRAAEAHANGGRGSIAAPFQVHPAQMSKDVEVHGIAVGGSDGDFSWNGKTLGYVRRPPGIENSRNVFAIYCIGDSMAPRYEAGDLIYLDPDRPPRAGDDLVIEMYGPREDEPGPCYLKRLVRRTADKLICEQFNPRRDDLVYDRSKIRREYRVIPAAELLGV